MAKFRKKERIIVEAEQFDGTREEAARLRLRREYHGENRTLWWLDDGPDKDISYQVWRDNWIVTDEYGDRFVCKPDIFDATYEPVDPRSQMYPRVRKDLPVA
jgi:hypothetical protein